jgi:hypothetical protein
MFQGILLLLIDQTFYGCATNNLIVEFILMLAKEFIALSLIAFDKR